MRGYIKEMNPTYDFSKVNNHLLSITQLTYVVQEIVDDLCEELKSKRLYVQDVKNNIKQIVNKLKNFYPAVDFSKLDDEKSIDYVNDYSRIRDIIYSLFDLSDEYSYALYVKHRVGQKVWGMIDGNVRELLICDVKININGDSYSKDFYCKVLNKAGRPINSNLIAFKEEELYKHKKDLTNETD